MLLCNNPAFIHHPILNIPKMKTPSSVTDNKLQFVDCLRGVAIIMVIANHADWYLPVMHEKVQALSNYGQMGVQLFFMVSAYTLCLSMFRRSSDGENLKTFYIRRYFRIAPLYYIGIPLYFCYHSIAVPLLEGRSIAIDDAYTPFNILVNLLMVNDFVPGDANSKVVPGGWSIGTETTFYLVFPFIFYLYNKYKDRVTALSLIPLVGCLISMAAFKALEYFAVEVVEYNNFNYFNRNNKFLYYSILCQLPVFLMGMSLFFREQKMPKATRLDKVYVLLSFATFTFFSLVVYVYYDRFISLLVFLPAISFFFLFILFKEVKLLNPRWLARIGQLSFSIYLFHFVFAFEGSRFLGALLQPYMATEIIFLANIVVTTVLSAGVAVLSEKWIEKPGMEWGRRIIQKIKSRKQAAQLALE